MAASRYVLLNARRIGGGASTPMIGVEWNQAIDTWRRIDEFGISITSLPLASSDPYFNSHPIWGAIKRCTLADNGTVNNYGTNPRGDGLTKDGSDGQVMVQIPKCWSKVANPSANVYQWWFSTFAATGFSVDPAFLQRGGTERDYIYVGAYEANNDGGAPNKLRSITGAAVDNNKTISTFRINAEARGSVRWGITGIHTLSLLRRLFYVEYAGADSQSLIGRGRVDAASGLVTGADSADTNVGVNGTGTGTGVDGLTPIVWRGIENLWSNYYQFIDGYEARDAPSNYRIIKRDGNGTFRNPMQAGDYEASIAAPIVADGYQSNILYEDNQMKLLMIPNAVAGASTSYLYDQFYAHDAGKCNILLFGGCWADADEAGVAFLHSLNVAANVYTYISGRLEFV